MPAGQRVEWTVRMFVALDSHGLCALHVRIESYGRTNVPGSWCDSLVVTVMRVSQMERRNLNGVELCGAGLRAETSMRGASILTGRRNRRSSRIRRASSALVVRRGVRSTNRPVQAARTRKDGHPRHTRAFRRPNRVFAIAPSSPRDDRTGCSNSIVAQVCAQPVRRVGSIRRPQIRMPR